jgi:hypothetical protein
MRCVPLHKQVWHRGRQFELQVVEVRPESAACIIDSDVELDLDLPAEVCS